MTADMKIEGAGHVIREARDAAGLSQRALAKLIGMPVSTLYRYESNERPLNLQITVRIGVACQVEPAVLAFSCVKTAFPDVGNSRLGKSLERIVELFVKELSVEDR